MKFFYINRKGSAIAFALIIATLLLISEAFLMNQNQNNIIARRKNIENLQSYFAARAGMQHVMLKTQIMPTQLYDATCFHLGKNPYFDFSLYPEDDKPSEVFKIKKIGDKYIKLATNVNPGPRFLGENKGNVKSGESEWLVAKNQSLTSVSYDKPKDSIPHFDKNSNHPDKFLYHFYDDINSAENKSSTNIPYPYEFSYKIASFSVLALEGERKYNEEAIRTTVIGEWKDEKGVMKEYRITSVFRVQRFKNEK